MDHVLVTQPAVTFTRLGDHATISAVGLSMPEDATVRDWQLVGETLVTVETGLQFWIGDWLNIAAARWPDFDYATFAAERFGWRRATIRQYCWVARCVPPQRRHPDLGWAHHRAVSDLMPSQQVRWLARAAHERWSSNALMARLRVAAAKRGRPVVIWVEVACDSPQDAARLMRRMAAEGRQTRQHV